MSDNYAGTSPAKLRALADWVEGLADAIASAAPGFGGLWRATVHAQERVRELRALADHLDQLTEEEGEAMREPNVQQIERMPPVAERPTGDTLPQWLHRRFAGIQEEWSELGSDDEDFWRHEARAVRRAVARGGFKTPTS